jgi:cytochrome c biogenesis protein CcmG/thiol:disulfide interchange protein DsbE
MDRRLVVGMLKDWGLALGIVVAVLIVWSAFHPGGPSSGPAPDFTVTDLEGAPVSLADLKGDVVVLNFWATWCGPCRAEIPEFSEYATEHPEIEVIGISVDDNMGAARLNAFAKKLGITYRVLHDEHDAASSAYGVEGIPVTFVLDSKREIRAVLHGSTSKEALAAAVSRAQ